MVLGGGESGFGAALLAQVKGHPVFLSDSGPLKEKYQKALAAAGIEYEMGQHSEARILAAQLVVKSPGIPRESALIRKIEKAGIPLISEVEWAYRYCEGKIIAITGTNGKTTTTHLVHHLLKKAGYRSALVGNVGQSFAAAVAQNAADYYALEVSSFQLDDVDRFRPNIAILLNISADHLERYQNNFDQYRAAKLKIGARQGPEDYFLYNADDEAILAVLEEHGAGQALPFSQRQKLSQGAYLEDNRITITTQEQSPMNIDELALQGKHNAYNSMAAGLAGRLLGIRKETIRESLAGFESIEHRLEQVLQIYGINFINDSKATNVNSTWYALESMQSPTIWIAGGVDKGNDYSQLEALARKKIKALICLGEDNSKLVKAFGEIIPQVFEAAEMDEAVRLAYKLGSKGDTVLLSPACASFDLFENYEDRGRQFKNAVRNL